MKKKTLFACAAIIALIASTSKSSAQAWTSSGSDLVPNSSTNNVILSTANKLGLGTSTPLYAPLTINGNIDFEPTPGLSAYRVIFGKNPNYGLALWSADSWVSGGSVLLNGDNNSINPGSVSLVATPVHLSPSELAFDFVGATSSGFTNHYVTINKGGKVGINTVTPEATDMLTVDGDIGYAQSNNFKSFSGRSPNYGLAVYANRTWNDGAGILMYGSSSTVQPGSISMVSTAPSSTSAAPNEAAFEFVGANGSGNFTNYFMHINKAGQIAMGTTVSDPHDKLTVSGNIGFDPLYTDFHSIFGRSPNNGLTIHADHDWQSGASIALWGSTGNQPGAITFLSTAGNANDIAYSFVPVQANFGSNGGTWLDPYLQIWKSGQVAIGSDVIANNNIPYGYNLYVSKGILTEKVKVALTSSANWSDFVFNDDYNLKSLSSVESYIKDNKHLPDVPSATEVAKDGIDVATMDAKLLQKIEELTLYMIQQQKEIESLKKQIK